MVILTRHRPVVHIGKVAHEGALIGSPLDPHSSQSSKRVYVPLRHLHLDLISKTVARVNPVDG